MARHRLVHGIVHRFGKEMMQRLLIGAANIHAGPTAHRLQPFQHLDIGRGIALITVAFHHACLGGLRRHFGFELVKKVLHLVLGHQNSSRISRFGDFILPTPDRRHCPRCGRCQGQVVI